MELHQRTRIDCVDSAIVGPSVHMRDCLNLLHEFHLFLRTKSITVNFIVSHLAGTTSFKHVFRLAEICLAAFGGWYVIDLFVDVRSITVHA